MALKPRGAARALALLLGFILAAPALARSPGPPVVEQRLPNGARLLVSEQHTLPMVLVTVLVDAGAWLDPPGREGLANLVAEVLVQGTATRSGPEIAETIEGVGGSLSAAATIDYTSLSLRVLRKDLDLGLDLLADVLLHPAFAPAELARRREAVLGAMRAAEDDPDQVAEKAFRRTVFAGEPYGHPVEGLPETVNRITRQDLRAFYERYYGPTGAVIAVVGDVTASEAAAALGRRLAEWRQRPAAPVRAYPTPRPERAARVRIDRPVNQATIILGHRGLPRNHPDFEAVTVMNYILGGGGFASRLLQRIRTEAGLAYSVASFFTVRRFPGSFQIVMQTKNPSAAEATRLARAEVERIRREPVSAKELEDARRYLTGSFPLRLDTNSKIASFLARTAFYGLGTDYAARYLERVRAVTAEDVLRVARTYLHPDALTEVVVADLAAAKLPPATP